MSTRLFRPALIALLILTLTQSACGLFTPQSQPSQADIEKEEQAVYAFFANDLNGPMVILQDTSTNMDLDNPKQMLDYIKSGLKSVSKDTIDNYMERNAQPSQLSPDMDLGVKYVLLSDEERNAIFKQSDGWDAFYKKYSMAGYTEFSRVGFNRTLDQALVYVGWVGGPLMGDGTYYLLEKQNGKWILKEQIMVWIS